MKYPRRLLESTEDGLARRVLRSAQHDRPSPSATIGTGRLLGLSASLLGTLTGGVAGAAAGTTAAGAAAGTAAAGAAATGAAQVGGLVVAKYVGIGVIAGVLATGGAVAVRSAYHDGQPGRTAPVAASSASASARRVTSAGHAFAASRTTHAPQAPRALLEVRRPDRAALTPPVGPTALGAGETVQASPEPSVAAFETTEDPPALGAPSLGPEGPSLSEEVALLDRARQALRERNPPEALRQLDLHGQRAPYGSLVTEATVLRVEALVQAGRRKEAAQLARQIIAQAPDSRHASRVRALVPEAEQK